jgi:hypothetical protein
MKKGVPKVIDGGKERKENEKEGRTTGRKKVKQEWPFRSYRHYAIKTYWGAILVLDRVEWSASFSGVFIAVNETYWNRQEVDGPRVVLGKLTKREPLPLPRNRNSGRPTDSLATILTEI